MILTQSCKDNNCFRLCMANLLHSNSGFKDVARSKYIGIVVENNSRMIGFVSYAYDFDRNKTTMKLGWTGAILRLAFKVSRLPPVSSIRSHLETLEKYILWLRKIERLSINWVSFIHVIGNEKYFIICYFVNMKDNIDCFKVIKILDKDILVN